MMRTPSEHQPIPTIRHGVFLSKQLKPLVYNKTPRRHAATTFIFIIFFQLTPQTSTYGGFGGVKKSYINPRSAFRVQFTVDLPQSSAIRGSRIGDNFT